MILFLCTRFMVHHDHRGRPEAPRSRSGNVFVPIGDREYRRRSRVSRRTRGLRGGPVETSKRIFPWSLGSYGRFNVPNTSTRPFTLGKGSGPFRIYGKKDGFFFFWPEQRILLLLPCRRKNKVKSVNS